MPLPQARLRRGARARVIQGHPWVFRGELEDPLPAADAVELLDAQGGFLGRGLLSPGTLALRMLTRDPKEAVDAALFERRFGKALALRRRDLPGEEAFRLCAGEADFLPGLTVDVYAGHAVLQATTVGMDRRLPEIVEALRAVLDPASVLARHDVPSRAREGLPLEKRQLAGETPKEIEVRIGGMAFDVDPWEGQKTGFYLDQRAQYRLLEGRCKGLRILDAFCHLGAWARKACLEGAREAVAVDSSGPALERARRKAPDSLHFEEANAFDWLRSASDRGERFDGIVLDPPPFAKSKDDLQGALRAYKELNLRALKMLPEGGWLYTASCSQRVTPEAFEACLRAAAVDAGRSVRILEATGHAPDHPVLLEVPETRYLKGLFLEVAS